MKSCHCIVFCSFDLYQYLKIVNQQSWFWFVIREIIKVSRLKIQNHIINFPEAELARPARVPRPSLV